MIEFLDSVWPHLQTAVEIVVVLAVLLVLLAICPDVRP